LIIPAAGARTFVDDAKTALGNQDATLHVLR
jgi:hypothetical protein